MEENIQPVSPGRKIGCSHSWCYDNKILTSNPPKQYRICSECGKLEMVTVGTCGQGDYDSLLKKFNLL